MDLSVRWQSGHRNTAHAAETALGEKSVEHRNPGPRQLLRTHRRAPLQAHGPRGRRLGPGRAALQPARRARRPRHPAPSGGRAAGRGAGDGAGRLRHPGTARPRRVRDPGGRRPGRPHDRAGRGRGTGRRPAGGAGPRLVPRRGRHRRRRGRHRRTPHPARGFGPLGDERAVAGRLHRLPGRTAARAAPAWPYDRLGLHPTRPGRR